MGGAEVVDNNPSGISVLNGSTLSLNGSAPIQDNGDSGITVQINSTAELFSQSPISDNGNWGVLCVAGSSAYAVGNLWVAVNNVDGNVDCP